MSTYSTVMRLRLGSSYSLSAARRSASGYFLLTGMMAERVSSSGALSDTAKPISVSRARSFSAGTMPQVEMVTLRLDIWGPSGSVMTFAALITLS